MYVTKKSHIGKLEDLLKALLKNCLNISPKKCQFCRKELQYMGNTIFVKDRRVCIKPLRSRLETVQKLKPPTTVKGCRHFSGMENFLSIFCSELQKLLKPIFDLTRKGRQFIWVDLPDSKQRFYLYSDMSKFATESTLYQIQNGKLKLIAYASKRVTEAARNYSITELEMCGLAINIASFTH